MNNVRCGKMTDQNQQHDDSDLFAFTTRLRDRAFDPSCCFLCARNLDEAHLTDEHVIPKWAQKRYNLWDQQLILLNGTGLPYRKVTVPCCEDCNKERLQPIELSVASAVSKGPDAVRALGRKILFLWIGKVFYGILYREVSLLLDRGSSDGLTVATPEMLKKLETHLFFLQEAREKVELVDFTPGSIYVFKCQTPRDSRLQWDFCDNVLTTFIGIRMGKVGIIAVLADGGAQLVYQDGYKDIYDLPLHPMQFRELCAHFSYRSTIATRTPKLVTISGEPHQVIQLPLGGFSMKPYFGEWVEEDYSWFLAYYTGWPHEKVFSPPDRVMTWLHGPDGKLQHLDFEEYPFGPENP